MYTQCPECMTIFAIDAATIAQAHGCVGCGHCGATFDTMATLTDELPSAPFEALELNHPSAEPPLVVQCVEPAQAPQQFISEPTSAIDAEDGQDADPVIDFAMDASINVEPDPALDAMLDFDAAVRHLNELDSGTPEAARKDDNFQLTQDVTEQLDDFVEPAQDARKAAPDVLDLDAEIAAVSARLTRRERMGGPLRKRLAIGCATLAACLVLQLTWAERAVLARNSISGPLLREICSVFGCTPMVKNLDQLALISRDVRKHPSVANALIISATMRNNATFAQPFPIVTISLSDLDDNRVAMRRFRPAEYLHDPDIRAAGLDPGASTALVFEVQDPGQDAVAFEFSFE